MTFGGPLLQKNSKMTVRFRPIEDIEPILRTLGYIRPKETIIVIPSNIKKEVISLRDENHRR